MWWYFLKLTQNEKTVTYSYGYESKELTGVFECNIKTKDIKIIKYAMNHTEKDQAVFPIPVCHLIDTHKIPDEKIIAIG